MSDTIWQEIASLRERVKQAEMNHELLTRALEQRLGQIERVLMPAQAPVQGMPAPNGRQGVPT
jgi:hypothetical protein